MRETGAGPRPRRPRSGADLVQDAEPRSGADLVQVGAEPAERAEAIKPGAQAPGTSKKKTIEPAKRAAAASATRARFVFKQDYVLLVLPPPAAAELVVLPGVPEMLPVLVELPVPVPVVPMLAPVPMLDPVLLLVLE